MSCFLSRCFGFLALCLFLSSLSVNAQDTIPAKIDLPALPRILHEKLNDVDTNYIEPQKYNFTAMVQMTVDYEMYRLLNKEGQSLLFAPRNTVKVGPYFGWRWAFWGYTFDLKHFNRKSRTQYTFSIYTSKIGVDLFWRKTGEDYLIRKAELTDITTDNLRNIPFDGLKSKMKGANVYYIFNHRRFSYPAAFSQSTVQRRSAGSLLAGVGYTKHELTLDHKKLQEIIDSHTDGTQKLDSTLHFNKIKYHNITASVGYAYNYVPCRNLLFSGSLSSMLAYNRSTGDVKDEDETKQLFSFRNFNVDAVARLACVYNTGKFFFGANATIHAYNYRKPQFQTNNIFGNLNVYAGVNFGRKKSKKDEK